MDLVALAKAPNKVNHVFDNLTFRFLYPGLDLWNNPARAWMAYGLMGVFSVCDELDVNERDDRLCCVVDWRDPRMISRGADEIWRNIHALPNLISVDACEPQTVDLCMYAIVVELPPTLSGAKVRLIAGDDTGDVIPIRLFDRLYDDAADIERLKRHVGYDKREELLTWVNDYTKPRSGVYDRYYDLSVRRTAIEMSALAPAAVKPFHAPDETFSFVR